ncbi:SAM-dependent methyltransferase [Candidatus Altiarchaeota archaeon]
MSETLEQKGPGLFGDDFPQVMELLSQSSGAVKSQTGLSLRGFKGTVGYVLGGGSLDFEQQRQKKAAEKEGRDATKKARAHRDERQATAYGHVEELFTHFLEEGGVPPDMDAEALREDIYPNLLGKKSAEKVISENKITEPRLIKLAQDNAFPFSKFQELTLYGKGGFFDSQVDFTASGDDKSSRHMPLFPQLLTPYFGRMMGEAIFGCYASASWPYPKDVTLVGLGAGRGYLDHDVIEHLTGPSFFNQPEFAHFQDKMRQARFIVSDRTDRSIGLLNEYLGDLIDERGLQDRVSIQKINVLDFDLGKQPFGIFYSNELLDALPVEPIIQDGDKKYSVFVVPHMPGKEVDDGNDFQKEMNARFPEIEGAALSRDEFEGLVGSNEVKKVKFTPVLVPLEASPELSFEVERSEAVRQNINSPRFGGIYPFQIGLKRLLDNAKKSFDHGVIIFDDYHSTSEGYHNYNKGINLFSEHVFGEDDFDFQLDFDQVKETGSRMRMECGLELSQKELLDRGQHLLQAMGKKEIRRWAKANNVQGDMKELMFRFMIAQTFTNQTLSDKYTIMALQF